MAYRNFTVWKDFYGLKYDMYKTDFVTLESGLTVLSGCNGAGKTSLILQLQQELEKQGIMNLTYNDVIHGRNRAMDDALNVKYDIKLLGILATSSEGEQLYHNLAEFARKIGDAVRRCAKINKRELWIFLDASDSGLSIDKIEELKKFIRMVLDDAAKSKIDMYFVVAANEYEMCRGEQCYYLPDMEYKEFKTYDDYRQAILDSRKYKDTCLENLKETLDSR